MKDRPNLLKRLKSLLTVKRKHKDLQAMPLPQETMLPTDGDQQTAQTYNGSQSLRMVSSIKDLTLKKFIDIAVNNNYDALIIEGNPTSEELTAAWEGILSQYYETRKDANTTIYFKKMGELWRLKQRLSRLDLLTSLIQRHGYIETACAFLREEYKLPFTEESYLTDVENVHKREIKSNIAHDNLVKEIEELNKVQGQTLDKESQEEGFYEMVMEINKLEHGMYSVDTMTVYLYAIACKRFDKYIENLQKQNITNGK